MLKTLKIVFSGSVVLTPDYPDNLAGAIPGPLVAVMPGARRGRKSKLLPDHLKAQFAFLKFDYDHLVVGPGYRDADYKHVVDQKRRLGLCFLEREELRLEPSPLETELTFDSTPVSDMPKEGDHGIGYVARWKDFAKGNARLKRGVLQSQGDYVRMILPGGEVRGEFVEEPIARISFDYGADPATCPYAQQIAVALTFPEETASVTFRSYPFGLEPDEPARLTLRWFDAPVIEVLVANSTLASIRTVLADSIVGQDHEGDFDLDFEALYDVINCKDIDGKLPLPQIKSREILRVPCIASMIGSSEAAESWQEDAVAAPRRREPGEPRPGREEGHD